MAREDTQFKPGQTGNPEGRGASSKRKSGRAFWKAYAEDFELHGKEAIERVRIESPAQYVKLGAEALPAESRIEIDDRRDEASDEDVLAMAEAVIATARARSERVR